MIDFNIANFVSVGLISVAFYAALIFMLEKLGARPAWL